MLISVPGLPKELWAEAVGTSIYLTNRSPTKALPKGKTPHELLYGTMPRYRHIKTFGCAAYALKPHAKDEGKLAPRSEKLWLLGYEATTIFRLWDPVKRIVRTSRNVTFNEAELATTNSRTSTPTTSPTPESNTDSDAESNADSDAASSAESIDEPTFRPTTRSMTRKSTSQEAVGASKPTNTVDLAIVMPEQDAEVEYEDWTTEVIPPAKAFYATTTGLNDDQPSYDRAMKGPEAPQWKQGLQSEYDSLIERKVWTLVPTPQDVKIFHPKWVLQRKRNEHNEIVRHKARLVLRGYEQVPGRDYGDTYAPTVRSETSRLLLSLTAKYDWECDQLDAITAFLNSKIDRKIYMWQPNGFPKEPGKVCLLNLALYGMKQSAKLWADTNANGLQSIGYTKSKHDDALWFRHSDRTYVTTHVDDFKVYAPNRRIIDAAKQQIMNLFPMKDLGPIRFYLGMKVDRNRDARTIQLTQTAAIDRILDEAKLTDCSPCQTPMEHGLQLEGAKEPSQILNQKAYAHLNGRLLHLAMNTRPDIAFVVSRLAQYTIQPNSQCWAALKRLIRYLKGTRTKGIVYGIQPNPAITDDDACHIKGYTDSDWAGETSTCKSTSGYLFLGAGAPIAWGSNKQPIVALSTCEAEYVAASDAAREATWLRNLLAELDPPGAPATSLPQNEPNHLPPIPMAMDNQGAIALATLGSQNRRTRHINVRYHYIRDCIESGTIAPHYTPTSDMLADGFTKALDRQKFSTFVSSIGIRDSIV
jgi:Reverse transcriptase (RNA-dependent DNA polymerase)